MARRRGATAALIASAAALALALLATGSLATVKPKAGTYSGDVGGFQINFHVAKDRTEVTGLRTTYEPTLCSGIPPSPEPEFVKFPTLAIHGTHFSGSVAKGTEKVVGHFKTATEAVGKVSLHFKVPGNPEPCDSEAEFTAKLRGASRPAVASRRAGESFELAGTVTQGGCGGGSHACTRLPRGETLSVSIESSGRRIDSVPVGRDGHYGITLPAGYYQVTPGLSHSGPVTLTHFSPETLPVDLRGDVAGVDFTYGVVEHADPIGRLRFGGALGDVPFVRFSIGPGRGGPRSKDVSVVTEEASSFKPLLRAAAKGTHFGRVRFEVFNRHTRAVVYFLTLEDVDLSSVQAAAEGEELRLSLVARSASTEP